MADQNKAQGRAGTWPGASGVAVPWHVPLPRFAGPIVAQISQWAAAEVAPGRLMPWLPVGFGFGIVLYFTAEREPVWWVAAATAAMAVGISWLSRARPVAFPLALAVAAIASGFAAATVKSRLVDHVVLRAPAYGVSLKGFVERREELERSDRIVLHVANMEGGRAGAHPERIRISVRKGTAPAVGTFVALKARINPPSSPFRPGGYDLSRDLYFQRIGATGLATGGITVEAPPAPPSLALRFATAVEGLRDAIDGRIRATLKGDTGAIASALITGKRDALTAPVFDAMFISGVGHVLSISGYHMALVAGVVFFFVRALLALVPVLALHYPIKKWAAAAALAAATFYLVLSGAEVATQRSYIMAAVVLVGVMVDRATLTMRTIAVAAFAVMLLVPEAVVHPSFQMSFAATLALIAAYERGIPWAAAGADTSLGARLAVWGVREVILLITASLVAGLATMPYAAYHFHRMAPYGLIANLFAMPVISAVSMPAGLLALLAMPFGFDAPLWRLMGVGIDWMVMVALWVAHLPGAVGRISAFGVGAMLLATAGLIVLCLLRSPLRFAGAALAGLAIAAALMAPRPDILISGAGDVVAVRGADSRLAAIKFGNDTISVREWLAADGDERAPTDASVKRGFTCDADGCVARLTDGTAVAVARTPAALADDCARAAVVVTTRPTPPGCAAVVVDRNILRPGGATALIWRNDSFERLSARPEGQDRPWAPAPVQRAARTNPAPASEPADATPSAPDIDAEQ
jgi:competence protein ComEC